jgi:hypothetical protein
MKKIFALSVMLAFILGCGGSESDQADQQIAAGAQVNHQAPEPLQLPEAKVPESNEDWESLVHNKEIEVIQVLNIINPVAVYLTEGFKQYGEQIKNETLHEEWDDTVVQLTQSQTLYEDCKKRKEAKKFDKQLFLDMENTWQLLVKTGVAGVRTKQMLDAELVKL